MDWGDAAGWAQAISTGVALWLALRQGGEASRRDAERNRSALHSAYGAAQGVRQTTSLALAEVYLAGNTPAGAARAARALDSLELRAASQLLLSFDLTRLSQPASGFVLIAQLAVLDVFRALAGIRDGADSIAGLHAAEGRLNEVVGKLVPLMTVSEAPRWNAISEISG